ARARAIARRSALGRGAPRRPRRGRRVVGVGLVPRHDHPHAAAFPRRAPGPAGRLRSDLADPRDPWRRDHLLRRGDAGPGSGRARAHGGRASRGRRREAIHALYLFALTTLVAREAIRYDPALTDRELLVRAAAVPNADALRDLVALYERSWFGLRDPGADEARRARSLALRVAG